MFLAERYKFNHISVDHQRAECDGGKTYTSKTFKNVLGHQQQLQNFLIIFGCYIFLCPAITQQNIFLQKYNVIVHATAALWAELIQDWEIS